MKTPSSEKQLNMVKMLDDSSFFTRPQQYILISMRICGKITGQQAMSQYMNKRFFESIKPLIEAGWVRKHVNECENGRATSYYTLTPKGLEFNSQLMQHPQFRPIWNMLDRKIVMA